jgi:ATP-dependent helicase HrpB
MRTLPIDASRDALAAALSTPGERPVVVVAPTGSGKSTRLPLWLDAWGHGPVLVIEPRRVACRALAGFLREAVPEARVGYRVRFEDVSDASTRILFVTPGVALRLLTAAELPFRSVLFDEFHERGLEVDLALCVLRARQAPPRLVLTSATVEGPQLAARLDATLVEAMGRSYPVTIEHEAAPDAPTSRDLIPRLHTALARLPDDDGDALVFLPGKGEIEAAQRELAGLAAARGISLLPLHGSQSAAESARALRPTTGRRVVLATNVAETSLTLPGITRVIDSGLERRRQHRAGRSVLVLGPVSAASLAQRAGRAGRTAPGRCLRLFSAGYAAPAVAAPEISRLPLDDMVLAAAAAGLDARNLERAPWLDPPPPFALAAARERLARWGALDDEGGLTARGAHLATLPVSAFEARWLAAPPEALAATVADLVALLSREQDLFLPLERLPAARRDDVALAREALCAGARHEVAVRLLCLRRGDPRVHGLNESALAEARQAAGQLRAIVGVTARVADDRSALPADDVLAAYLLARVAEVGFVLRPRADRADRDGSDEAPWSNGEEELWMHPYAPPGAPPSTAKTGVVLAHSWMAARSGTGVRGRGHLFLPCAKAVLAEAQLGTLEVADPHLERGRVVARVERQLAGVLLDSGDACLSGAPLRRAMATLVEADRLWRGVREDILDALHVWRLLARSDLHDDLDAPVPSIPSAPADLSSWLVARLDALGPDAPEDIELLSGKDLVPDLAALAGGDTTRVARLRADFPREFADQGAQYSCTVDAARRTVTLEPVNAAARKRGAPSATILPRFRGFSVVYVQASRRIVLRG